MRDLNLLIYPVCLHITENGKVLLNEVKLEVDEGGEVAQLQDLVLLDSIHSCADVFCRLLAVHTTLATSAEQNTIAPH